MMPTQDWDGPSVDKIERVVKRTLRRLEGEPDDPLDTPGPEMTAGDAADIVESGLRLCGLIPSPPLPGETHPLASAGIKLKELRARSGWTVEEIADRTRMSLDILKAFEDGDSDAAGTMTTFHLETLASVCCGTLADLLGPEHSWVQAAWRRQFGFGRGCAVDPHG